MRLVSSGLGDEDELKMIDLGVVDIERGEGEWIVYCEKERTYEIKDEMEKMGYQITNTELVMRPINPIEVNDPELKKKVENLLDKLSDLEDVHKVWTN